MDLTNIDQLNINGKRVVSISSDSLEGYVWNEKYVLRFLYPEELGGNKITSFSMYHGIDNVFPLVQDPYPPEGYEGYVFQGWSPDLPEDGSTVCSSMSFEAQFQSLPDDSESPPESED